MASFESEKVQTFDLGALLSVAALTGEEESYLQGAIQMALEDLARELNMRLSFLGLSVSLAKEGKALEFRAVGPEWDNFLMTRMVNDMRREGKLKGDD